MGRKMNIEIDLDNFTEEQENKFAELLNIGKNGHKNRVWKPKINEDYYYISSLENVNSSNWNNGKIGNFRWGSGNVFKTKEEAEFALEKMIVKTELERYAREHNDPDLEEWNGYNPHYVIQCLAREDTLEIGELFYHRSESVTYFTSEKIAEDAIKAVGEKRIMKYLFGVDCEEDE